MFALTKRLTLRPVWPEEAARLPRLPRAMSAGDGGATTCAIATRDGSAPRTVGVIRLTRTSDGGEIAVAIDPASRGNGYATEAAQAMLEIARWSVGMRRVTARIAADDRHAARLLIGLGFVAVGERGAVRQFERRIDDGATTGLMPPSQIGAIATAA